MLMHVWKTGARRSRDFISIIQNGASNRSRSRCWSKRWLPRVSATAAKQIFCLPLHLQDAV
jgi:hypothetical protein